MLWIIMSYGKWDNKWDKKKKKAKLLRVLRFLWNNDSQDVVLGPSSSESLSKMKILAPFIHI